MSNSKGKGLKGLKGRHRSNTNVSLPALSKQHKLLISGLKIWAKQPSSHGNTKAVCWAYFGSIKFCSDDNVETVLDKTRYYCSLCLCQLRSTSTEGKTCHISDIGNYSQQTSSGNFNMHLSSKHSMV